MNEKSPLVTLIELIDQYEQKRDFMNQSTIKGIAKKMLDLESKQHFERFLEGFKYSREGFNGETFEGKPDSVIEKNIVEDYHKIFANE